MNIIKAWNHYLGMLVVLKLRYFVINSYLSSSIILYLPMLIGIFSMPLCHPWSTNPNMHFSFLFCLTISLFITWYSMCVGVCMRIAGLYSICILCELLVSFVYALPRFSSSYWYCCLCFWLLVYMHQIIRTLGLSLCSWYPCIVFHFHNSPPL